MSSSLLDALHSVTGSGLVDTVASRLGEPEAAVSQGFSAGFASILAGLVNQASGSGGLRQIFDLVSTHASTASAAVDNPASVAPLAGAPGSNGSSLANAGQQLLSSVLPGNLGSIGTLIAGASGLRPESANTILSMAGPLVLGVLGKRIQQGGLNAESFGALLSSEKDSILSAAPSGISNLLGVFGGAKSAAAGAGTAVTGAAASMIGTAQSAIDSPQRSSSTGRWLWPLLILLVLLGFWWTRCRGNTSANEVGTTSAMMADSLKQAGANAVTGAASALGNLVGRALPNGTTLQVPENGIESKLIAFIQDSTRPVSDTVWFNFDRLLFETGSATLQPQSQEQVQNIANIMSAYPAVNIRIGGYTDNTGNPAANLKLSQDRANTVRTAIVALGVDGSRLDAKGYGDAHPVADNSTEEGRATNRRIALRVTKK